MSTDEHAGTLYYSVMFCQYLCIYMTYIYYIYIQILSVKKPDSKKGQRGLIHFAARIVHLVLRRSPVYIQ